jgi:hypothetical protein
MKGCTLMLTRVFVHDWDGALEFYRKTPGLGVSYPSAVTLCDSET